MMLLLYLINAKEIRFSYETAPDTSYSGYRLTNNDVIFMNKTYPSWFKNNIICVRDLCTCTSMHYDNEYIYYTGWTDTYGYPSRLIQSFNDYNISYTLRFEWSGKYIKRENVIFKFQP